MEKTAAILIRRLRFEDTTLICTWLSQDCGKIKTFARHALQPKSPLYGRLDLFFEVEIGFVAGRKEGMLFLREAQLLSPFGGLGLKYTNFMVASYFAKLTDQATDISLSSKPVYDLLKRALQFLQHQPATFQVISHFESQLGRCLGIFTDATSLSAREILQEYCGSLPPFPLSVVE